jgi:hypothetical protein
LKPPAQKLFEVTSIAVATLVRRSYEVPHAGWVMPLVVMVILLFSVLSKMKTVFLVPRNIIWAETPESPTTRKPPAGASSSKSMSDEPPRRIAWRWWPLRGWCGRWLAAADAVDASRRTEESSMAGRRTT